MFVALEILYAPGVYSWSLSWNASQSSFATQSPPWLVVISSAHILVVCLLPPQSPTLAQNLPLCGEATNLQWEYPQPWSKLLFGLMGSICTLKPSNVSVLPRLSYFSNENHFSILLQNVALIYVDLNVFVPIYLAKNDNMSSLISMLMARNCCRRK